MVDKNYEITIIGGGIAGFSAAIYCARLNLKTIIINKESGGTLTKVDTIENYPGFKKIQGMELANKVIEHAKNSGKITIINGKVIKTSGLKKCFTIQTKKHKFTTRTIIFCTGSKVKTLNVPGEKEFTNKGVHYCALCDGPLYKNKILAVIGGGDSATKEALLLSTYAKKIYMVSRSKLRGEPINLNKIKKDKKVELIEDNLINEIKGDKFVTSLTLNKKYQNQSTLNVDGIFIYIGHIPLSDTAKTLGVKLNKNKEIIIDKESKTNIEGIYAAGDVSDTRFKQAITGVGEAVKAVYSAYEYLSKTKPLFRCAVEE